MDMKAIHADALTSSITAYHEFLQYYKKSAQIVYGFVEGKEDLSFYRGLIDSKLPDGWKAKLIKSDDKNKVLKLFNEMNWSRFPKRRVCFFVDRDLSEFLEGETTSGENLYVTDNYSIENDVVNFSIMERVQEEVFGVTGLDPTEIISIQNLFESNLTIFSESMAPVMAQIILWRRANAKVSLDNIEPRKFFTFKSGQIMLNPKFDLPSQRVQYAALRVKAPQAEEREIAEVEAEFRRKKGLEKYIRGKYLQWFFVYCAEAIHKAIPSLCTKYEKPPKIHIALCVENCIMVVGPRVRCPASLNTFLERNYCEYIKGVTFAA